MSDIIERYLHDLVNARTMLMDHRSSDRHGSARRMIGDVLNYFVDHLEDVATARRAIAARRDPEGRQMTDLIDAFMSTHAVAREETSAALKRAGVIFPDPGTH